MRSIEERLHKIEKRLDNIDVVNEGINDVIQSLCKEIGIKITTNERCRLTVKRICKECGREVEG